MRLKRDFGLLNSVDTVVDYGVFKSWIECNFVLYSYKFMVFGSEVGGFNKNNPHNLIDLSIWSLVCSSCQ